MWKVACRRRNLVRIPKIVRFVPIVPFVPCAISKLFSPISKFEYTFKNADNRENRVNLIFLFVRIVPFVPFVPDFETFLQEFGFPIYFWKCGQTGQSGTIRFPREILPTYHKIFNNAIVKWFQF